MTSTRQRLGAVAIGCVARLATAAAVLAPLAIHWLGGRTLPWFDSQHLFAPQRWIADEALRALVRQGTIVSALGLALLGAGLLLLPRRAAPAPDPGQDPPP